MQARNVVLWLVTALLARSQIACQSAPAVGPSPITQSSGAASSEAGNLPKLQLKSGYATTSASQASLWAAKDGGYFDAEGLDISLTQAGLAKLGIAKGQVGFVATGAPPQTLAAIQAGQIQGASFTPPESLQARAAGLHELVDIGALNIPTQQSAAITTRRYAREHPDVVERFVRATIKGTNRLIGDREFAIRTIGAYAQVDDRDALGETIDYYSNLWTKDGFPSLPGIQQILDTTTVPDAKDAKPEQFVDMSFVEKIKSQGVS